jgi:hypothetical protein
MDDMAKYDGRCQSQSKLFGRSVFLKCMKKKDLQVADDFSNLVPNTPGVPGFVPHTSIIRQPPTNINGGGGGGVLSLLPTGPPSSNDDEDGNLGSPVLMTTFYQQPTGLSIPTFTAVQPVPVAPPVPAAPSVVMVTMLTSVIKPSIAATTVVQQQQQQQPPAVVRTLTQQLAQQLPPQPPAAAVVHTVTQLPQQQQQRYSTLVKTMPVSEYAAMLGAAKTTLPVKA